MSKREWIKKIAVIIIGSVIAAYGITLALYAGFGGATLAVLWQGISGTFHVSIGAASFIVAVIMILFVLIYDRYVYSYARSGERQMNLRGNSRTLQTAFRQAYL